MIKFKSNSSSFYRTVKERVNAYFQETGKPSHADFEMILKTAAIAVLYLITYAAILSNTLSWPYFLAAYSFMGFLYALSGFNISHDALHGAYASTPFLNRLIGYSFDFNGESSLIWKITHNNQHHIYTNIPGADSDIGKSPFLRFSTADPWKPYYRYQAWYFPLLYSLVTLNWVVLGDYLLFYKYRSQISKGEGALFFLFKGINLFFIVLLPMYLVDLPWWMPVLGFVILHLTSGTFISFVFQLAHLVEEVQFPVPDPDGKMEDEWAVHELKTTSNFATDSRFLQILLGGLNFQVEHHLFPGVCHVHYPAISKILRSAALEHGIPYHEHKTVRSALASHVRFLDKLGRGEV